MNDQEFTEISRYAMRAKLVSLLEMFDDKSLIVTELSIELGTNDIGDPVQIITVKTLGARMERNDGTSQLQQSGQSALMDAEGNNKRGDASHGERSAKVDDVRDMSPTGRTSLHREDIGREGFPKIRMPRSN